MYKLKLKLKQWRKQILKFVAKILATELVKTVLLPLIFGGSLLALLIYAKEFLLGLLQSPIIQLPQQILLYQFLLILISVSLLILLIIFIIKFIKRTRIEFMDEYGFKWKIDKKNKKIESHPYCPDHQIKLKLNRIIGGYVAAGYKYNIYCQICQKNLFENYPMENLRIIYNLVVDKYEAIKNKHNKGF